MFPFFFIDNCIKHFKDKLFTTRKSSNTIPDKKEIFIFLECLGKISLQSKKQLIDILRTCRKKMKLNVLFRSLNKIRNSFCFKDQIPIYMNSDVIYKYKCNICSDVYISKTKLQFLVRQYEHLGRLILTEKPLKYNEKDATAVRKHCHQQNHPADSFCFSLIGNATNNYHLKLKESLVILKFKPSLNIAKESMPLYLFENDS